MIIPLLAFRSGILAAALAVPTPPPFPSTLERPSDLVVHERRAAAAWHELFAFNLPWPVRQIATIRRRDAVQFLTLMSARLLYQGKPWTWRRSDNDAFANKAWVREDRDVKDEILRELRYHDNAGLADVYRRFLSTEDNPELVLSCLANLWQQDPASARDAALRLADPSLPHALPGSMWLSVREHATAFLVDVAGVDGVQAHRALEAAVLGTRGDERVHAIRLIPHGALPVLIGQAVHDMVEENQRHALTGEDRTALVLACGRLAAIPATGIAHGLADLAVHALPDLAIAAAQCLATGAPSGLDLPVAAIADRARRETDLPLRDALLHLLVRVSPTTVAGVAGPHSPWTLLAAHAMALRTWDMQALVR